MFICNCCNKTFEEPIIKTYTEYEEFWGAMVPRSYEESFCPTCGDEDYEECENQES